MEKMLMSPRELAKIIGISHNEVREKCKSGVWPHKVTYSAKGRPTYKVYAKPIIEMIEKECVKNAPFAPSEMKPEKPNRRTAKALSFD